ncbi:MAG: hypothetical protein RMY29_029995 [Nostoc sp. CreGUA01]
MGHGALGIGHWALDVWEDGEALILFPPSPHLPTLPTLPTPPHLPHPPHPPHLPMPHAPCPIPHLLYNY